MWEVGSETPGEIVIRGISADLPKTVWGLEIKESSVEKAEVM